MPKEPDVIQIDDLQAQLRKVERLQREADKAAGLESHLLARLKEEFGCDSLNEGERKLVELESEERAAARKYAKEFRAWKEKWSEVLKEVDDE